MKTFKTNKGTELPILDLKGKPYLQVAHRIVWFREEHPEWLIEVKFPQQTDKHVMAKAEITDETGRLRATAHKVEHFAHFADAMEKAETGSIGRALAMLGYGTQFTTDLDEGDRLADAPVDAIKKQAKPKAEAVPLSPENDADYVVPFGKLKGKALKELTYDDILKAVEWLENSAKTTNNGKPLMGNGLVFVQTAKRHLSKLDSMVEEQIPF